VRQDPFFGTPTGIVKGAAVVNPAARAASPEDGLLHERAEAICAAAYAVRSALFRAYETTHGEKADLLPLAEQTDLLLAAFCDRPQRIRFYWDGELARALEEFRRLVPLIPFSAVDALASGTIAVDPQAARQLLQQYSTGAYPPSELRSQAAKLARRAAVEFDDKADPVAETAALVEHIEAVRRRGPPWHELPEGTESRVYLSEQNQAVYKALPFRRELLHVKPILGDEDIEAGREHGTYLADPFGGMPLFDRARLMAQVPGFCRTELVAITASGLALYKQPFLGWDEPSPEAITEWAQQCGHACLPEQAPPADDLAVADAARLPIVAAAPSPGRYVIALDVNPRNARRWNGQAIPFDPVVRELRPEEIASHPRIHDAVRSIETCRTRRAAAPAI
jgi:hypothetical protein